MKRFILLSFLIAGCQTWGQWQPYSNLYISPSPTSQPIEETSTPQPVCIVSADEALNLRAGAGTSYAVKDWLKAGDSLTLTGNQRGTWLEVITKDHVKGWVNSKFCRGTK